MTNRHVLVLDDEKNITFVIKAILEKAGFSVDAFNDPLEGLKVVGAGRYCVVITDLYMPQLNGMEVLARVHEQMPDLPVIVITAFGTVESAVSALKKGAFDYITKPFEQDEILAIVEKAANTFGLGRLEPAPEPDSASTVQNIMHVGNCVQMQDVARMIQKIAASPSTVLITGESGTGKELVATAIHRTSDRSQKPFIKINCAAIPHNLIESELFGYEKGAFTGAVNSKPGRFELAHEGTLFLDEVAEMPLEMQVKLLRVIQESEFERIGGLSTVKVNVRLIAATNKDLQKEVKEGRFREDLYYRLNVVPILLPPLRDRRGDIEQMIYFFIKKFNDRLHKSVTSIDPECLRRLMNYYWPGNIRQLENVLEHAVLMSDLGILRLQDLPRELSEILAGNEGIEPVFPIMDGSESFKDIVKRQTQALERELISKALNDNDGNVTKTAEKLGLSRKGLQLKLKELGIRGEKAPE